MKYFYGLTKREHAYDIVEAVVEVLGGGELAVKLLLETAQQETHLGEFEDPTKYAAGTGITQFDEMPFYDIIRRTKIEHINLIKDAFGVDMRKVKWRELEYSPVLCFIATRLLYKKIPAAIPSTVKGRAKYWKVHYNTIEGRGTEKEYIKNADKI